MVARCTARLQPLDFVIVHRPGKHQSHADRLSRRTSRLCKREACPECKPLRKEAASKTETARSYTPTFPYQHHFDGYVEVSDEDAALFWEVDNNPTPDPESVSVDPTSLGRAAPIAEKAAPEKADQCQMIGQMTPDTWMHVPAPLMTTRKPSLQSQPTQPVDRIGRAPSHMPPQSPGPRTPRPLLALRPMRQINPEQRLCWRMKLQLS